MQLRRERELGLEPREEDAEEWVCGLVGEESEEGGVENGRGESEDLKDGPKDRSAPCK